VLIPNNIQCTCSRCLNNNLEWFNLFQTQLWAYHNNKCKLLPNSHYQRLMSLNWPKSLIQTKRDNSLVMLSIHKLKLHSDQLSQVKSLECLSMRML
jgi:hypothetical protein